MTKVTQALDFISKKGSARSVDIAEHIGCGASSVSAMLAPYVADGMLVSCLVERPGQRSCNEYRLSSTVHGGTGELRISAGEARPRQSVEKARPKADQAVPATRDHDKAPSVPPAQARVDRVGVDIDALGRHGTVGIRFSISCEEQLTVVRPGAEPVYLDRDATRRLARFLRNFVPEEEQRHGH